MIPTLENNSKKITGNSRKVFEIIKERLLFPYQNIQNVPVTDIRCRFH